MAAPTVDINTVPAQVQFKNLREQTRAVFKQMQTLNKEFNRNIALSQKLSGMLTGKLTPAERKVATAVKSTETALLRQSRVINATREKVLNFTQALKLSGATQQQQKFILRGVTQSLSSLERRMSSGVLTAREFQEAQARVTKTLGGAKRSLDIVKNALRKQEKAAAGAANKNKTLGSTFRNLGSSAVFAIGPLSGVGARLIAFQAIATRTGVKIALLAAGLTGLAVAAFKFAKALITARLRLDQTINTLRFATGSLEEAGRAFEFVSNTAIDLGTNLDASLKQFGQLAAAARGTTLEGKGVRDIFLGISQASVVLGLSADQTTGALRAIQQMISKGTVQAEELRGQLGERLPGAFQIAARAMGVTTRELGRLLEQGLVPAEEFVIKFSKALQDLFKLDSEKAAGRLASEFERLGSKIEALFNEFERSIEFGAAFAFLSRETGEFIDLLRPALRAQTELNEIQKKRINTLMQINTLERQNAKLALQPPRRGPESALSSEAQRLRGRTSSQAQIAANEFGLAALERQLLLLKELEAEVVEDLLKINALRPSLRSPENIGADTLAEAIVKAEGERVKAINEQILAFIKLNSELEKERGILKSIRRETEELIRLDLARTTGGLSTGADPRLPVGSIELVKNIKIRKAFNTAIEATIFLIQFENEVKKLGRAASQDTVNALLDEMLARQVANKATKELANQQARAFEAFKAQETARQKLATSKTSAGELITEFEKETAALNEATEARRKGVDAVEALTEARLVEAFAARFGKFATLDLVDGIRKAIAARKDATAAADELTKATNASFTAAKRIEGLRSGEKKRGTSAKEQLEIVKTANQVLRLRISGQDDQADSLEILSKIERKYGRLIADTIVELVKEMKISKELIEVLKLLTKTRGDFSKLENEIDALERMNKARKAGIVAIEELTFQLDFEKRVRALGIAGMDKETAALLILLIARKKATTEAKALTEAEEASFRAFQKAEAARNVVKGQESSAADLIRNLEQANDVLQLRIAGLGKEARALEIRNGLENKFNKNFLKGQIEALIALQLENDNLIAKLNEVNEFALILEDGFRSFGSSFVDSIKNGTNALDGLIGVLENTLASILDLIIQLTIINPLLNSIGGATRPTGLGGLGQLLGIGASALGASLGGGTGLGKGISPTGSDIAGTPFAHGGSFKVGGVGGVDKNRVNLDLTRGETVTVTPANQNAPGGNNITVNFFIPEGMTAKEFGDSQSQIGAIVAGTISTAAAGNG